MDKPNALIDQTPIVVTPCLIATYGAAAAILAQQIWYWQRNSEHFIDGHVWVYNPAREWSRQTGFDEKTIRRAVKKLTEMGVLVTANYNRFAADRTLWYSINQEVIEKQTQECLMDYPKRPNGMDKTPESHVDKTPGPIPKNTKSTTNTRDFVDDFLSGTQQPPHESVVAAMRDFVADRKERRKPMTARAVQQSFAKLEKWYPGNPESQVAAINQSIANSWMGLFEVKGQSSSSGMGVI